MKLEWKQIIAAWVLGVLLGSFGTLRCAQFGFHGPWGNPEKFRKHMMDKFTRKLSLTSDQQQKVSVILDETRVKLDALRQESRPKFEAIRNSSKEEIRKILTPEQIGKFEIMSAEMDAKFKKRHGGPRHQ